jgi:transposase-like protein
MLSFVTRTPRPQAEGAVSITWIQKQRVPDTTAIVQTTRTLKAGSFLFHSRHGKVKLVRAEGMGQLVVELCDKSKHVGEAVLLKDSDRQIVVEAADCGPPFSSMIKDGLPDTAQQAAAKRAAAGANATNPHAAMWLASKTKASSANPHAGFLLPLADTLVAGKGKEAAPTPMTTSKGKGKAPAVAEKKRRGRPKGSKDTQPRKKPATSVNVAWHYGGRKGQEGMSFGVIGTAVVHDQLGQGFLVGQASATLLMLQFGEGDDASIVTVDAREVQGTLAAETVPGAGSSRSSAPRPNRKKQGARATGSAALESEIKKKRIVTKAEAREIEKRKRREATAAKKGKPLKAAREKKNRNWSEELKAQAVQLYRSNFAVGNRYTDCAKHLGSHLPGFTGVSAANVRSWVEAALKLSEQEPNEYGLIVTNRGRLPTLKPELYEELKEQIVRLVATKAFTINTTSLRPIALSFVINKLGPNAIRPGKGGFVAGRTWLQQLVKAAGLKWRKPFGDARKHPPDAAKQIDDMILRLAYLMHEYDVPPALTVNFDHTGMHFMQMRGNTWTVVDGDKESQHFSREQKCSEVKQQAKGDKRQATGTVGTSMAGDVLPGQLIVEGVTTSKQALPELDGNKYVQATGSNCGHKTGYKLVQSGPDAQKGQLTRKWLGHLVQTSNHWANIPTSYAILEYIIVPWLVQKKAAIGKAPDAICILIVDCWYGWKDQDKKKTLISFRHYVRNHYPWLRLLFVPAACTDLAQPADRGFISWIKAFMRKCYTDIISASVMQQLQAGTLVGDIKIDTSAPFLKHMLAESFAKALSELPSEKVIHCWAPLQSAWEKKQELHAKAKEELARLFPNNTVDVGPKETEAEPDPVITDETGDDFDDDDDMEAFLAVVEAHTHLFQ